MCLYFGWKSLYSISNLESLHGGAGSLCCNLEFEYGVLLFGGILTSNWLYNEKFDWVGDMITRFSGITMCCIMTGVIWIGEPESLWDVILYDNLHVFLWVGGLFFALRGNRT